MNLSSSKEVTGDVRFDIFQHLKKRYICSYPRFECTARNARQVLFGITCVLDQKNGTATSFESVLLNKRLVPRQRIAPACSKRQPPRSNKCITILCLKNANDLQSKHGNKQKKVEAWS